MNIKEGYIKFKNYQTYYRIVNPDGKKIPLLMLHGGPGSTHNSFELFDHVAFEDDRPIIMYDQLGCGKSIIEKGHEELWTKETWVEELINLRKKLNLDKVNILGHSWGGMLAIIYLCDYHPEGVNSLILSSTLASAPLWEQECHRLINLLDDNTQKVIFDSIKNNDFESAEAKEAINKYYHKFVFGPWIKGIDQECLTREKPDSSESYITAWGKSEFAPTGTLKDYDYVDKLHLIKCPVLICNGANDESTALQNKVIYDNLDCPKIWNIYQHSRHQSYYEEHGLYVTYLVDFLNSIR